MKISKITYNNGIYYVYYTPNWFEKLFFKKPKAKKILKTSYVDIFGNPIYYTDAGKRLGIMNKTALAINLWDNKIQNE